MNGGDDWEDLVDRLLAEVQRRSVSPERPSDDAAWSDLRSRLDRIARILVDEEFVDDLVQAVALKLQTAETLARMRASGSPKGYAFMMMKNAGIDQRRQRFREPASLEITYDAPDPTPMQEQLLVGQAQRDQIKVLLDQLTDSDRLLVTLRFWDNLSIAEIALRLKLSYSNAAVRMFRLLRRLRSQLETEG